MDFSSVLNELISLSNQQGYLLQEQIDDLVETNDLDFDEYDYLLAELYSRKIIIYEDSSFVKNDKEVEETEYEDMAHIDYEEIYEEIIRLDPSLEGFVNKVRKIIPKQRYEVGKLLPQLKAGNAYARTRMIEMHLRVALSIALQRAKFFNVEISETLSVACEGLITAVDYFIENSDKEFTQNASFRIFSTISRSSELSKNNLFSYTAHINEKYTRARKFLIEKGCVHCDRLPYCVKAYNLVKDSLKDKDFEHQAKLIFNMAISSLSLDDLYFYLFDRDCSLQPSNHGTVDFIAYYDAVDRNLATSSESMLSSCYADELSRALRKVIAEKLKPIPATVIIDRYGLDGESLSLEEVGKKFNVTSERIRQIQKQAESKLKCKYLKSFCDYIIEGEKDLNDDPYAQEKQRKKRITEERIRLEKQVLAHNKKILEQEEKKRKQEKQHEQEIDSLNQKLEEVILEDKKQSKKINSEKLDDSSNEQITLHVEKLSNSLNRKNYATDRVSPNTKLTKEKSKSAEDIVTSQYEVISSTSFIPQEKEVLQNTSIFKNDFQSKNITDQDRKHPSVFIDRISSGFIKLKKKMGFKG